MPSTAACLSAAIVGLASAAALPAQGGGIVYAPGAHHYRVTSTITSTQEAGGRKAQVQIGTQNNVTLEVSPYKADTLHFAITLDSSTISSEPEMPLPDFHKYYGLNVKGAMSPAGEVFSTASSADSAGDPNAQRFVEGLSHFLLVLPKGATVGTSWADTITTPDGSGQAVQSRTITTSRVLGDTTYAGQKAWRIQQTSGTTLKGMVEQQGRQIPVNGQGTGTTMYYVSRAGVYLGSTMSQTVTIKAADGTATPMTQAGVSKTELIP
jgi:hypothetical protein